MSGLTKMLCRVGLHKWRLFNGLGYSQGKAFVVTFEKECRRCGKQGTGGWVL